MLYRAILLATGVGLGLGLFACEPVDDEPYAEADTDADTETDTDADTDAPYEFQFRSSTSFWFSTQKQRCRPLHKTTCSPGAFSQVQGEPCSSTGDTCWARYKHHTSGCPSGKGNYLKMECESISHHEHSEGVNSCMGCHLGSGHVPH